MKAGEICPDCGIGQIKERHGKYGWFLGCSKYPSCGFVSRDIEKGQSVSDKNTEEWFKQNNFKMVLKPKTLRYIETNNSTLIQQNPLLNFKTSTYNIPVAGFFSTQKSGINI